MEFLFVKIDIQIFHSIGSKISKIQIKYLHNNLFPIGNNSKFNLNRISDLYGNY